MFNFARVLATAAVASLGATGYAGPALAETNLTEGTAPEIVSEATWLSPQQISAGDISSTKAGQSAIRAAGGGSEGASPLRAYRFGDTTAVVSSAVKMTVRSGRDANGRRIAEVYPVAQGVPLGDAAGFVVPPNSAFKYNNENQFTTTSGTWIRKIWWQLQYANNYTCSGCGTYDYWRIYGRIQGSTETGTNGEQRVQEVVAGV